MINFPPGQLPKVLQELEQSSYDGIAEITVEVPPSQSKFSKIVVFRQGKSIFAHSQWVTPQELAEEIAKCLDISIIGAALKTAETKVSNSSSFQEIFSFLNRMKIIKFEQIEAFVRQEIVLTLEQLLPYGGTVETNSQINFDLACGEIENGWSLTDLASQLRERKQQWQRFAQAGITSAEAVPKVSPEGLRIISSSTAQKHCQDWINGRQSIQEIAEQLKQDPLKLAKDYYGWANQKWIYFGDTPPIANEEKPVTATVSESDYNLPTILSVDDSPVVQTMLKRSLSDRYEVILATNGMEALKILNSSKKRIELALLDVTMPDIDGIELCRTIRRFKKFQSLPIIMLTAKDGMLDKVKGKFAGSTEYLTKPVNREALLSTIGKYVPTLVTNQ